MKTREEIEQEYHLRRQTDYDVWLEASRRSQAWRDAALAELDDPLARLIAAAKKLLYRGHIFPESEGGPRYLEWHYPRAAPISGCARCQECVELRDAIDYAEQRRAQG